uniref:5'-3' exonuclease domain-containing protein n=1 Tax=Globisporangium ultimum (strain ATCC 200006 / CBS 805.95 / DAOM BR144) TaxID=431595 RepID=K3XCE0_GLOUD
MWLTTARAASGGATSDAPRNKKSLLVDGNNVLYHYYNPLLPANSDGVQREAIDGLIQLLKRMNKTHRPEHICVFFDSKRKPTVRKLIDPTYKSQRKPTPQSLGPQLASAAEILAEGGLNCITYPGFEADDLVASYTEAYVTAGYDVLVVSNDNDFLQLARGTSALDGAAPATTTPTQPVTSVGGSEQEEPLRNDAETRTPSGVVELYQPNKRRYIRERHLQSRFGLLHARLIPDFLALIGTRWGKIKKVDHMTEERAVELLTEYGSLPKLLRNLNSIEDPVLRKSLKHAISSIETSLRIAKLNDEIVLPIPLADLQAPQLDKLQIASAPVAATATAKRKSGAIRGKRVKDAN